MYYGARYYDPALARFITADTVYDRGPQGLNRYSYALNNPIVYNDPSGHLKIVPREDMSASVVTDEEVLQETDEYFGYGPKLKEDPQPPLERYVDEVLGDVLATLLRSEKNRRTGKQLSYYDRAEVFIQLETTVLIPGIVKAAGATSAGVGLADDAVSMADDTAGMVDDLAEEAAKNLVTVKDGKWDYFFGRVTSNPHNQARSLQNLKDLSTLGFDEASGGREALMKLFGQGKSLPEAAKHVTDYGTTITRTVPVNNVGAIDVKYFYPGGNMEAIPEISTITPKIFK